MKRLLIFFILVVSNFSLLGCSMKDENSYLRIHIRANSNSVEDQNIKYEVKDEIVEYLTPIICDISSVDELKNVLNMNKANIENYVNNYLLSNGFNYTCDMKINNEFFPTRNYGEITLKADYYDALIINLGSGSGDNWWCVVYPPLCFTSSKTSNSVVYKSKLVEIIKKFF